MAEYTPSQELKDALRAFGDACTFRAGYKEAGERLSAQLAAEVAKAVEAERERCALIADAAGQDEPYGHAKFRCVQIAGAIRTGGDGGEHA